MTTYQFAILKIVHNIHVTVDVITNVGTVLLLYMKQYTVPGYTVQYILYIMYCNVQYSVQQYSVQSIHSTVQYTVYIYSTI